MLKLHFGCRKTMEIRIHHNTLLLLLQKKNSLYLCRRVCWYYYRLLIPQPGSIIYSNSPPGTSDVWVRVSFLLSAAALIRQVMTCFFQYDQLIKAVWKTLAHEFPAWITTRLAHKEFLLSCFLRYLNSLPVYLFVL